MSEKVEVVHRNNSNIGFFGLLSIVLITLKLTGYIDWSWWLVTIFLWLPPVVIFAILLIFMVVVESGKRSRK
jgi:hypothetical protein